MEHLCHLINYPTVSVLLKVLAVMSYDVADSLPGDRAAIVIYRNLQDAVRTHFSEKSGTGAFLEAPLQAYYGNWICIVYNVGRPQNVYRALSLALCLSGVHPRACLCCDVNGDCDLTFTG
jgi:hypothetical protein